MEKKFSFKNLEQWQEDYLCDSIVSKLEKLGFSTTVIFERSSNGIIRGAVSAKNKWGNIYASAEKKDILVLSKELESSLFNQLHKRKSKTMSRRRNMAI